MPTCIACGRIERGLGDETLCMECENEADEAAAQPCECCGGEKGYVTGRLCTVCRNYEDF